MINLRESERDFEVSIPRLMALGILLTKSSAEERANRFYEINSPDLENQLEREDLDPSLFTILVSVAV